jgi:ribosome biogenesis GTPase A
MRHLPSLALFSCILTVCSAFSRSMWTAGRTAAINAVAAPFSRLSVARGAAKRSISGGDFPLDEAAPGAQLPVINWYPGHIAQAERELNEYIKRVDVVIELRDARIPMSTSHPKVSEWVGNRPLIVCVTRTDMVPAVAVQDWKQYYNVLHKQAANETGMAAPPVFFIDSKHGDNVARVKRAAIRAGEQINLKRERQGIRPRPVRVAVIGYPNVGKSALINRLLGRRMAKSQDKPGVTRQLQWIKLGGVGSSELELLDSPGIIPAKQVDQKSAMRLAICNDIGEASYDPSIAAAALLDRVRAIDLLLFVLD